MADYLFTKKAQIDLEEIWSYTKYKWSEQQADKYFNHIISVCQNISNHSEIEKPYDEIKSGLLGVLVKKHIIFFNRSNASQIIIIRILHQRMDLNAKL